MKKQFTKVLTVGLMLGAFGSFQSTTQFKPSHNRAIAGERDIYFGHVETHLICEKNDELLASITLKPYLVNGQEIPEDGYVNSNDLRVDIPKKLNGHTIEFNDPREYGISDVYLTAMNLPCDQESHINHNGEVREILGPVIPLSDKDKHLKIKINKKNKASAGFYQLDAGMYMCAPGVSSLHAKIKVKEEIIGLELNENIADVAKIKLKVGATEVRKASCYLNIKLGGE